MSPDLKTTQKLEAARAAASASPKPPTFWEQYRRNTQGMVGLGIVLVYVLVAVFAPVIAPHDPMNDLYLADSLAGPVWLSKISSKHRDLPPTIRLTLGHSDWDIEKPEDVQITSKEFASGSGMEIILPATITVKAEEHQTATQAPSAWTSTFKWDPFGTTDEQEKETTATSADEAAQDAAVLQYVFNYEYKQPQTFNTKFEYDIKAPEDAQTEILLEFITPSGKTFELWNTKARGAARHATALADARDLDLKRRLGISFFDEPTDVVFAEQGDYQLRLSFNAESPNGPVAIEVKPVEFGVLGMLHGVLGVDHMGSDIWSQLVYGTRIALAIGLSAAFIAVLIGTSVGMIAGYMGGIVDEVLMRIVDVLLAVPTMPILIILGALFGKSVVNVVILLALFSWMGIARIVRSQTLSLKERTFVESAKASGASSGYIMVSHILPNTMPLIFANLVLRIPSAILTEASLSFLGLGDPRVPTWGRILQNSRQFGGFTKMAWWWLLPPGLALTLLSLAFVFIGNAVNEILNPRYRERS